MPVAEALRVDQDDEVELESLRQLRGQRPHARASPGSAGSPMTQAIPSAWAASQPSRIELSSGAEPCATGSAAAADRGRHVGVREHRPDDRLGLGHDLRRRPVVDAQRGQADLVEADPLEPFLPRLGEPVPGLGPVADDGEAAGRAAQQQHLPLRVGQLLRLVHDDVRERAGEQVRVGVRQRRLVDQGVLRSPRPAASSPGRCRTRRRRHRSGCRRPWPCARARRRRRPRAGAGVAPPPGRRAAAGPRPAAAGRIPSRPGRPGAAASDISPGLSQGAHMRR